MRKLAAIIACALLGGPAALLVLIWAIGSGQYEDLEGAARRILLDDPDDHCAGS